MPILLSQKTKTDIQFLKESIRFVFSLRIRATSPLRTDRAIVLRGPKEPAFSQLGNKQKIRIV